MKNRLPLLLLLTILLHFNVFAENTDKVTTLRVLQLNTWCEGAIVENGKMGIMKTIEETSPDIVLLQEIRGQQFIDAIIEYFKKKGIVYYGKSLNISTAFLSKYPIQAIRSSDELGDDSYAFVKANVKIKDTEFVFYSMHLDWKHLSFYNLRGFDGHSDTRPYTRIEPERDVKKLIAENNLSRRTTEVETVIADAKKEIAHHRIVIMGGDFNEPSFLDWKRNTRALRNHHQLVIKWPCSVMLYKAGFRDCYRSIHPNAVTHPGFTCNAGNKAAPKRELCWAIGTDDRERIDQNYFYPDKRIKIIDAIIIGPKEDFWDNRIQYEPTQDPILTPDCVWPSDHKGVLTIYRLN